MYLLPASKIKPLKIKGLNGADGVSFRFAPLSGWLGGLCVLINVYHHSWIQWVFIDISMSYLRILRRKWRWTDSRKRKRMTIRYDALRIPTIDHRRGSFQTAGISLN